MDNHDYQVTVRYTRDYEFAAEFDEHPEFSPITFDEPPPLGEGAGPNAAAVFGAAIGDCLATSLVFCLRKARASIGDVTAHVTTHVARNPQGRLRVTGIDVELQPVLLDPDLSRLERCEGLFEDFCTVTASVRQGIPVNVTVAKPAGRQYQWQR